MNNLSKVLLAAFAGALAGVAAGFLLAPSSGKDTRDKLSEKTDEVIDYLTEFSSKLKDQADGLLSKAKEQKIVQNKATTPVV
jgi:gas vesicle protein